MKQIIRNVLVFLIGLITASLAAYFYFSLSGFPGDVTKLDPVELTGQEEAFITALSGEVYIMRNDSIITAETGFALFAGDIIKVVDESFCQVQFSTVASARIRSNTIIRIKQLFNLDNSPDIQTEILTGSMLYRVNKLREGEKLEVKSDDKIYSVRGTTFLVDRNSDGTYLIVEEGLIDISLEGSAIPFGKAGAGSRYFVAEGESAGDSASLTLTDEKAMSESGNLSILRFGENAPALVKTGVRTVPDDAQIYVNGILSGKGSFTGLYPSGENLTFLIRKRGYDDKVLTVSATSDLEYRIVLDPGKTDEPTLEAERELSAEQGAMEKIQTELTSRTERLKEVEALIVELKEKNGDLEAEAASSATRIRTMTDRIQDLEKTRTDLNSQVTELQRRLKESTAREEKLRELIKQIQEISSDSQ